MHGLSLVKELACMLDPKKKLQIIKKFQTHDGDTGSSEVQIAILTTEIEELIGHLKQHPKDHSSRRGLLRKVNSRRHLLRYLKKENLESFEVLAKKLKLKQARLLAKPGAEAVVAEEVIDEEVDLKEHESAT